MKRIYVDAFTFEVARTLNEDFGETIGGRFDEQRRLVAIVFALRDLGFVNQDDLRKGRLLFVFTERAKKLPPASDEKLAELVEHKICFELKSSKWSRLVSLAAEYRTHINIGVVESIWSNVGLIIDYILADGFRLTGPEKNSGLIAEHLVRSTVSEKCFVWVVHTKPDEALVLDLLEQPVAKGACRRFTLKDADAASESERRYLSLLGVPRPS